MEDGSSLTVCWLPALSLSRLVNGLGRRSSFSLAAANGEIGAADAGCFRFNAAASSASEASREASLSAAAFSCSNTGGSPAAALSVGPTLIPRPPGMHLTVEEVEEGAFPT